MPHEFRVESLVKRYAGVQVLDRASFAIGPGEILGYLGPNGSGKSTTIKIITGLIEPTSGAVFFDGAKVTEDPAAFRRRFGYVPEEPALYTHLTAPEYLRLVGRIRGMAPARLDPQITELLRLLDLEAASLSVMTAFSKGMRQRVLLAAALLHDPDLLILDEPFSGLDVNASRLLRALIKAMADRGKMILLSSHQMELVETLCPRVVILHKGKVVAEGSPAELRSTRHEASLEAVFAMVTEQEDYAARANRIIEVAQGS